MTGMNANALLIGANNVKTYHQAILLSDIVRRQLFQADREIRSCLRDATKRLMAMGKSMAFATQKYREKKQSPLSVELRFLRQGGLAYDTAVEPAFMPPQQSDLDDGVYARTSFLSQQEPGLAAQQYFRLVEEALQPLCDAKGWTLVTNKDTCVRINLDDTKHIDLPLYAISDSEFVTLLHAVRDATGYEFTTAAKSLGSVLDQHRDLRIPTDRVMLAHRKLGWIASDPRSLHDWFMKQVDRYGPQLQRECRYLKGWRDFKFAHGGPSSIALMVCAVQRYSEHGWVAENKRDDLSLLEIATRLPDMFRDKIRNPVLTDAPPLNEWEELERQRNIQAASALLEKINGAINGTVNSDLTVKKFQEALGGRVPYRPDLVKAFAKAPEAVTRATVIGTPLPLTRKTTSG